MNAALSCVLFLFLSLFGGGAYSIFSGGPASNLEFASAVQTPTSAHLALKNPTQQQNIDYSRPDGADDLSFNAGGPVDINELESANDIEAVVKTLKSSANPAYIPSIWPHASKINNEFGFRRNPFGGRTYEFHAGLDIDGERGEEVIAPAGGVVSEAGWKGGYGNMIEIDHGNGLKTRYGHLSQIEVEAGAPISRGQMIGQVGSTGRSTGPHLHYELRVNDRPINPRFFLPPEPTELKKAEK